MKRKTVMRVILLAAFLTAVTVPALAELTGNQLKIIFPTEDDKFSLWNNAFCEGYIRMQIWV